MIIAVVSIPWKDGLRPDAKTWYDQAFGSADEIYRDVKGLLRKDSMELDDGDRAAIEKACRSAPEKAIVITHGISPVEHLAPRILSNFVKVNICHGDGPFILSNLRIIQPGRNNESLTRIQFRINGLIIFKEPAIRLKGERVICKFITRHIICIPL